MERADPEEKPAAEGLNRAISCPLACPAHDRSAAPGPDGPALGGPALGGPDTPCTKRRAAALFPTTPYRRCNGGNFAPYLPVGRDVRRS